MPYEEDTIALLERGRVEAEATEAARQARYTSEDAARKAQRAMEDELKAEGDNVREAKIAALEAAIKARGVPLQQQVAEQQAAIARLTALIEKAAEPAAAVVDAAHAPAA